MIWAPKLLIVLVQSPLAYFQTLLPPRHTFSKTSCPTTLEVNPASCYNRGHWDEFSGYFFPFPTGLSWICLLSTLSTLQTPSSNSLSSVLTTADQGKEPGKLWKPVGNHRIVQFGKAFQDPQV